MLHRPLIAALFLGSLILFSPAEAAERPTCTPPAVLKLEGKTYSCVIPGNPPGPSDPNEPPAPLPCDMDDAAGLPTVDQWGSPIGSPFCVGTSVCAIGEFHTPMAPPADPKPSPESEMKLRYCTDGLFGAVDITPIWTGADEPPSLAEQAQEAIGNIDLGTATVAISPTTRTIVNLDTWFWLDGTMPAEAVGTSAFDLRAIATFRSLRVTTGDGRTLTCPFVTSAEAAEEECTHTYRRSSQGKDLTVSAVATYDLRFEVAGQPIESIPGAPDTLDGPVTSAPLRVDEVQTVVRPG